MDVLKSLKLEQENASTCSAQGWLDTAGARLIESINPATAKTIAKVFTCSRDDHDSVVKQSVAAQKAWANVPAPKRGEAIRRIGEELRKHKDALGSLVAMEMGKIKQEGDGEVQEMIDIADFAVGQSRMLYGRTMHSERPEHRMYEQWHPLGVVGIISAFNFPVAVWSWNAFIAAVAGNTVIWKPSSKTPLCAIAIQHICNHVMEEMGHPGIFSMFLPEDNNIAQRFVDDKRIGLISFTGSSKVGHTVARSVSKRLGRYLLECSGNNAIIVDETADLKLAVPAIVFGAVGTAGQRCTSTRRLIVHESIYKTLVAQLVNAYKQIRIGNPLDKDVLMGPLIDKHAVNDFRAAIGHVQARGGNILHGGRVIKEDGYFVEPTLVEVKRQYAIVRQETFAPILYVMRYRNMEGAIHLQNDVPQGLSSAIFTNSVKNAELFLSHRGSDCGIANVNIGTSGAEIGGAFGGEKETGGGREAGSDCWKAYMRRQTNTINWSDELPLAQGIEFDL
ncbi:aldehyde dehydrogenase [Candidatus Tenderia electrophaga]|jgi:aldehyde dehydrogenase (NAD+)|uniref:aldehyde dehydrogenase (NAD(+)) n=1 Tax=Candidatus Tenderia electrophaga TaxID=1748243 RepID=A0A0S2TGF5_9GAMM|nr:aldehyde dehydrogenase [Candidatus Tenderia electrophaga]